jgi:hypothetical protein
LWKRQQRREQLHRLKAAGFTAEATPDGAGPQDAEDADYD